MAYENKEKGLERRKKKTPANYNREIQIVLNVCQWTPLTSVYSRESMHEFTMEVLKSYKKQKQISITKYQNTDFGKQVRSTLKSKKKNFMI